MSNVRALDTTVSIYGGNGVHSSPEAKESKAPLNQNMDAEFKHDWRFPSISVDCPAQSFIGGVYNSCCIMSRESPGQRDPMTRVLFQFCEAPLRGLFHCSYRYYERNGAYSEGPRSHTECCCSALLCSAATVYCFVECPLYTVSAIIEGVCCSDVHKIVADAKFYLRYNDLDELLKLFDSSSSIDRDMLVLKLHCQMVGLVLSYEATNVSLHRKKQMLMYIFERGYSILNGISYQNIEPYNGRHVETVIKSKSNDSLALLDFILTTGGRVDKDKVYEYLLERFQNKSISFEAAADKACVLAKHKIRNIKIDEIFGDNINEPVVHEYFNTGKSFGVHRFGLYATSRLTLPGSKVSADVVNIICDYLRKSN